LIIDIDRHGNSTTMRLAGHFDRDAHRDFNKARYPLLNAGNIDTLILDLSGVDYIDSSALGMLLMLNGDAEKSRIGVTLRGCRPTILQVLKIANFHKMFRIV
jgi:anti-anti-sigma factor